ncbi:hypothetical protein JOF41_002746 [Saccharothrix coeruleofusca]|uniref:GAF domain-containing protein n=1 Tax=Saccharothrix coeruleofusca TaxID=33919 RepID=UPI001AE1C84F|nr:GAF domain-containing protein [Saccharothrix coeruleofusca]MBP2336568.1 hypothetical protein [Saccharothrix coeruleofusca]
MGFAAGNRDDQWHADEERNVLVWRRIERRAALEGTAVMPRHVCGAAGEALNGTGVLLYQGWGEAGVRPVALSGPPAEELGEAQVTLGEGPALSALRHRCPVPAADLMAPTGAARWPVFASWAVSRDVAAVFAFPVMMGAVAVGCLEVHRAAAGPLTPQEWADGLLLADSAMLVLLRGGPAGAARDPHTDAVEARWVRVQQAIGVLSVQLDSDLATASARLRAHAYCTERRLTAVADDVVAHRLRLESDAGGDDFPWW